MALDDYINQINRNLGQSARDHTVSNAFYGLNMTQHNAALPANTENHGYTFFTRPAMNMSYDNLVVDRVLQNLLVNSPNSVQRMVRMYFDHTLENEGVTSGGVDNRNAFMPLLSNTLVSLSGWPDFTLNTTTSNPGIYREAYSYIDDVPYNYETFDLQANFRNITGDPISFMMLMWGWYMGLVYEGRIIPYPEQLLLNEIDYQTRIYRIITDASKQYVTRIGACGAAFPMTAPIGNVFNFEGDGAETPFPTTNDQISINFRCMGFTYYDNILVDEFNTVVKLFNADMDDPEVRGSMVKLTKVEKNYFNYSAYPRINPLTMELEWWVPKDQYDREQVGVIRRNANAE